VGYVVAPPPLLQRIALSRWAADFNTDVVTQAALTELLASGALERHVRRVRRIYAERRTALMAALERHMPEGTRWNDPAGGNTVWLRIPADADRDAVVAGFRSEGIACGWGGAFVVPGLRASDADRHLVLCFARVSPVQIEEGIARLGEILRAARSVTRIAAGGRTP
jgi:DNA-binding transcriptional MocR family regulator